jgi:simple sugar transport system ATP-binding protein
MSILTGLYLPTEGSIEIDGQETKIESPSDAIAHGIGMVHQHFKLINTFTVAENIALSQSHGSFLLKEDEIAAEIGKFGEKYGLYVDPKAFIWQLSVGEKQRVEILRMLYHDSKILILDEPTAVLTPQETRELFINLRRMADDGCAVVFISHKMNEVLELADQVTVLRGGVVTGSIGKAEMERHKLIKMMIGRDVLNAYEKSDARIGDVGPGN